MIELVDLLRANSHIFALISGHRCFVCAPNTRKFADIQELKKMFGNVKIPKCSHYYRRRQQEFIQECPKESRGCVTQFEGTDKLLIKQFFNNDFFREIHLILLTNRLNRGITVKYP